MKILEVNQLKTGYDPEVDVLRGLSFSIEEEECVAMVGANGAGKSTLMKTISGILKPKSGEIFYRGQRIDGMLPHEIVNLGIVQVPEEGGTFPNLTIEENLMISCRRKKAKMERQKNLELVYQSFPQLLAKKGQLAGSLSGGQRKMLSIGKAIMESPEMLLLDDISMGLAPKVVEDLYRMLKDLTLKMDIPVLIVEQIVEIALDFAQRGYVMTQGEIVLEGSSAALLDTEAVQKIYIGT